ncbi:hypothetical protein ACFYV7_26720 [Nocardia suismassiliense]|uniref:Uncharacterized protein n=1 Tax=Nocardia suismassiliense TaxID=2077092 RepID=A0ABW6QYR9_9NOCA
MPKLIIGVVATIITLTSGLRLVFSLKDPDQPFSMVQILLLMMFTIPGLIAMYFEIEDYRKSRPKRYSSDRDVRDHMYRLIDRGGSVSVLTRDLSWVDDSKMSDMLRHKAQRDELTLVMPRPIPVSEELKAAGARVIYYGDHYTIKSRFTICNLDRVDSTVSIGWSSGEKHVIEKYEQQGGHPAFALAQDLVGVLRLARK